jgi:hypothetical protein
MYCNRKAGDTDTFYTTNQGQLLLNEYDIKYTAGRRATEKNKDDKTVRTAKAAREILLYSPSIVTMNCRTVAPVKIKKEKVKTTVANNNYDQLMEVTSNA